VHHSLPKINKTEYSTPIGETEGTDFPPLNPGLQNLASCTCTKGVTFIFRPSDFAITGVQFPRNIISQQLNMNTKISVTRPKPVSNKQK